MTIALWIHKPNCRSDLVDLLGKDMRITSPKPIPGPYHDQFHDAWKYGIADVPRLDTIQQLYKQSHQVLEESSDVSEEELETLRTDSEKHPNILFRRECKEEYNRLLQALANSVPRQGRYSGDSKPKVEAAKDLSDVAHIIERFSRLDMRD